MSARRTAAAALLAALGIGALAGGAAAQPQPRATVLRSGAVQSGAPVLAGSIFKLAYGDKSSAPVAGASVYLHPTSSRSDGDWIGPNLTDAYGRFTFQGPPNGAYLMRIYSGTARLWEQVVQIPSTLQPVVIRDVRVIYYPKSADGDAVAAVLGKLAFPYDKATAVNAIPTNTVWFGDRVAVSDVKAIADALVRGGVTIRAIRRFHVGSDWRAKVVEIGASPTRIAGPALQPTDIAANKDFPRD